MAEGKCREHWNHTSSILAVLINANRGKGDRAVKPSDLNPYEARRREGPVMKVKMSELRPFFERNFKGGSSSGN